MMFATSHPVLRRNLYAPAGRALERFLADAMVDGRNASPQYKQDETAFHLALDMPGVTREQLAITIEDSVVRIHSREGAPRHYRAAYELPTEIDATQSEAKLENGVLTLKLFKKLPVNNAIEIAVQ
jgi:HSP20 family protein